MKVRAIVDHDRKRIPTCGADFFVNACGSKGIQWFKLKWADYPDPRKRRPCKRCAKIRRKK